MKPLGQEGRHRARPGGASYTNKRAKKKLVPGSLLELAARVCLECVESGSQGQAGSITKARGQ